MSRGILRLTLKQNGGFSKVGSRSLYYTDNYLVTPNPAFHGNYFIPDLPDPVFNVKIESVSEARPVPNGLSLEFPFRC